MKDSQYLLNVRAIINELLKNAAHSSGIDFMRLNETAIETNKRIYMLGIDTMNQEGVKYFTIKKEDVGKGILDREEKKIYLSGCMEITFPGDVGKRVYIDDEGITSVENDEQFQNRKLKEKI